MSSHPMFDGLKVYIPSVTGYRAHFQDRVHHRRYGHISLDLKVIIIAVLITSLKIPQLQMWAKDRGTFQRRNFTSWNLKL